MKLLNRLLADIPDQVLSTFLLVAMLYFFYRGAVETWNNPPPIKYVWVVLALGIVLGVIRAVVTLNHPEYHPLDNEKDN